MSAATTKKIIERKNQADRKSDSQSLHSRSFITVIDTMVKISIAPQLAITKYSTRPSCVGHVIQNTGSEAQTMLAASKARDRRAKTPMLHGNIASPPRKHC